MTSIPTSGILAYNLQRSKDLLLEHLRRTPSNRPKDLEQYTQDYGRLRQQLIFAVMKAGFTIEEAKRIVQDIKDQVQEEDRKKDREWARTSMRDRGIEG